MTTTTILSPTYEEPHTAAATLAPRLMPTDPVTITIVENAKPNAKQLLGHIAEELRSRIPVADIIMHSKPAASKPIDADDAEMLAARSHMVISGLGD